MRRRTKDAVLWKLRPDRADHRVELSAKHAHIYGTQLQRQRQKVLGLVGDVTKHRFEILKSLTILRQMALDPALVDDEHEGVGSAKLDRLVDDLTQVLAEEPGALVFSQFTRYLAPGCGTATPPASTTLPRRPHPPARGRHLRFKDGDVPVFVISLKAGGVGHQPHRGRLLLRARPLVEPGHRDPGRRPGPPHRPDQPRGRLPPRLGRHHQER
ncbi:MAG: hypothetical protein R2711_09065 [Acidimicrobiales bacterium]